MAPFEALNSRQLDAVNHAGTHLLIVAGPGTGKTRTLVARVVRLAQGLKAPHKVLAITFTNKAADEMRDRLDGLLPDRPECVEVGTFHAFALKLLREYRERLPFPLNFTIATPDEIAILAAEFLPQASRKERRALLEKVSAWKATLETESADPGINGFRSFLREARLVDFDDILREAVFLLRDNADIAAEVRGRYPFVGVDEYQDVNPVQVELLKLLTKDSVQLTVIGDPNQAIYGFRGSDVGFFRDFSATFPPCVRVELTDNYRSAENLLEASGQMICAGTGASQRLRVPELVARIHHQGRLTVHSASGEKAEALYVAGEIGRLIGATGHHGPQAGHEGGGYSFKDIAVLFRLNAQAKAFETVFAEQGIPFQTAGVRPTGLGLASRRVLRGLESAAQLLPELERLRPLDPVLAADWERVAAFARQVKSVEEFLDRLSLETPEDAYAAKAEKVALLTLHAAKGLEFPVVFIVGCEDGLIPLDVMPFGQQGRERTLGCGEQVVGCESGNEGENGAPSSLSPHLDSRPTTQSPQLDEERRLFYVGMTRARERLYFVRARKRMLFGQALELPASPFLSDIRVALETSLPPKLSRRKQQEREQMKLF